MRALCYSRGGSRCSQRTPSGKVTIEIKDMSWDFNGSVLFYAKTSRKIRRCAVSIGRPAPAINRIKQPLSLKSPAQRRDRLVDSRFPVPVSINSPSYADISRLDRFDFEARKQLSQRDGTRFVPRSTLDAARDTVGWGSFNRAVEPVKKKTGKSGEKGERVKEKRMTRQREREREKKRKIGKNRGDAKEVGEKRVEKEEAEREKEGEEKNRRGIQSISDYRLSSTGPKVRGVWRPILSRLCQSA